MPSNDRMSEDTLCSLQHNSSGSSSSTANRWPCEGGRYSQRQTGQVCTVCARQADYKNEREKQACAFDDSLRNSADETTNCRVVRVVPPPPPPLLPFPWKACCYVINWTCQLLRDYIWLICLAPANGRNPNFEHILRLPYLTEWHCDTRERERKRERASCSASISHEIGLLN